MSQLVVALPKSGKSSAHRVGGYLGALFEQAGLVKTESVARRDDYTMSDVSGSLTFQTVEAPSLGCARYLTDGVADVAIIGMNRLAEIAYEQDNDAIDDIFFAPLGIAETDCSVVLAYPKDKPQGLQVCEGGVVVTSHFNLTAQYMNRMKIKPAKLIAFDGATETACRLYKADALVDITQTGSSLVANDLTRGEDIMRSTAVIAWRQSDNAKKRASISALTERIVPNVQMGQSLRKVMASL